MNNNVIIIPTNPEEAQAGVLSALDTIFNPSNVQMQANRHAADQYLIAFQRAPVAWQLADKLLSYYNTNANANNGTVVNVNDNLSSSPIVTQVHFFAAQTLHVKCRSDILQLDPSMLPSLRDSLMAHLSNFIEAKVGSKKSNTVVITRLAMTLCSLAVQMQWTDIIGNLLSKVPMMNATTAGVGATATRDDDDEGMIQVILEIAKILPEEAASERLLLRDESQRRRFREALVENSRALFQFLVYCITMHDTSSHTTNQHQHQHHNMKEQVFRCLHSWVHYVHIHPMLLQESQLLNIAFAILQQYDTNNSNQSFDDEDVFELAVDVVVEVLRCYPSDRRENVGLVQKLIPLIMPLGAGAIPMNMNIGIGIAGEQQHKNGPFQVAIQEQDEDGMRAYCRIFTEMGESYMSLIMHHEDMNQKQLVDLVLACSAIPNDGKSMSVKSVIS